MQRATIFNIDDIEEVISIVLKVKQQITELLIFLFESKWLSTFYFHICYAESSHSQNGQETVSRDVPNVKQVM